MHDLQELVRLGRMNVGVRKRARLLRMSTRTERKYRLAIEEAGLWEGPVDALPELSELRAVIDAAYPPSRVGTRTSTAEPWRSAVESALRDGVGPQALHDRLRREGAESLCSLSALKRMYATLRRERGPRPEDVAIPVVTGPGEVAQVDFGAVGQLFDPSTGKVRRAWVFVMVLGFSRHAYARVVFDQSVATWLDLHVRAFRWFGGVPQTIVPDNLKAAVIRGAFGAGDRHEVALNRSYRELARYYGFQIDPTPTYSPEKKGKVESAVKYVKQNFFGAGDFETAEEANAELPTWLMKIAGERQHRALGRTPLAAFADERPKLRELPAKPFRPVVWKQCTVHPDSHIQFDGRLYSVPWKLMGEKAWVRATPDTVYVFYKDSRVATHDRRGTTRRSTNDAHLPEGRRDLRHRTRPYWLERARKMGPEVGAYIESVFDSDAELSRLRDVQAIVSFLEDYPPERQKAAVARARFYALYSYQSIKRILIRALDREPLPTATDSTAQPLTSPRFARPVEDFVRTTYPESDDECH